MAISREFIGIWIPKEIWLDRSLGYFEKCLLAEIRSLEGENGCFASNEYFCEFFNERERKIQEGISLLKAHGYVAVKSFDGRNRILITSLNPKNDKSLFSTSDLRDQNLRTSGVRNSAPLGCENPHLSTNNIPYIEKREENKEQQQRGAETHSQKAAAAVPSERKFFKSLDIIAIPEADKIEISDTYKESVVRDGVEWAMQQQDQGLIRKSLAAAIKFGCARGLRPEASKESVAGENKDWAQQFDGMTSDKGRLDVLNHGVEFVFTNAQRSPNCIEYSHKDFKNLVNINIKYFGFL